MHSVVIDFMRVTLVKVYRELFPDNDLIKFYERERERQGKIQTKITLEEFCCTVIQKLMS